MATATIHTILLNYGGADKSISEMKPEDIERAATNIVRRAKEKAFSKGLPIYYSRKGKVLAEYSDGHIETAEE